jgi:hypothetical protein
MIVGMVTDQKYSNALREFQNRKLGYRSKKYVSPDQGHFDLGL